MLTTLSAILSLYFICIIMSPFPLWESYTRILFSVLFSNNNTISIRTKLFHLIFLAKEFVLIPIWTLLWYFDEIFFGNYRNTQINGVYLLVGQPRSGTTFLHRILCEDNSLFIGIKHLEWRYPFIIFTKLLDIFQLRLWVENRKYWPNNKWGHIALLMHPQKLGDYEEDGVFFEERFLHHYFLFRRFPYPDLFPYIASFSQGVLSSSAEKKIMNVHRKVLQKVLYMRGTHTTNILLKENESIDLIRLYTKYYPIKGIVGLVRPSQEIIRSFDALSRYSSMAKRNESSALSEEWRTANINHRAREFLEMYRFFTEDTQHQDFPSTIITFQGATKFPVSIVKHIYYSFGLKLTDKYLSKLAEQEKKQGTRTSGYTLEDIGSNLDCAVYDRWVKNVELQIAESNIKTLK